MERETPMMEQYHRIKSEHGDAILLFRLGDFYEMFEQDALEASSILNIALTRRNNVPMCGFPYHASGTYIAKLIREGRKIAICEQREDPATAKGIVKREVVEVISPGLITDPGFLSNKSNNCIASLCGFEGKEGLRLACASLDVSTGEFTSCVLGEEDLLDGFLSEVEESGIREVIHPEGMKGSGAFARFVERVKMAKGDLVFREAPDRLFDRKDAGETLKKQFSLANAGVLELQEEIETAACGALLSYVRQNMKQDGSHIRWVREKHPHDLLVIDNATKRHLELTESQLGGREKATLLGVLDGTMTAMGGRLLRKMVCAPSRDLQTIRGRLQKVEQLVRHGELLAQVRGALSKILDMERILSKLSVGKGTPRDLLGLKTSLRACTELAARLAGAAGFEEVFAEELRGMGDFSGLVRAVEDSIVDDPPLSVKEGGIIKKGYNAGLDELRAASQENREWINRYQGEQREKTGITSLKVRYNKIIGFYIEVTKPNAHLVPVYFVKKQTLVGAERYTTEELEKHETLLLEARESSNSLEERLFEGVRDAVLGAARELYGAAERIARLDVYGALAHAAVEYGYVKPEVVEENIIEITGGRHPVVERFGEESFIENDLTLDDSGRRIMILTGPNMAGKSTYLRQCALIVIMAHMGSFVPAISVKVGLVDRVFSRIGMSDRLIKGESTFLVEMIETSRILHYATPRSFIIMDEIGRGTSTYDGLSIAWAVLEYLRDLDGAKALFATHYHEITALGGDRGVINCNVTVKEWNDRVVFLRKIVPGCASKSYGIEVARMAGIPDVLIDRAKTILEALEANNGICIPFITGEGGTGAESERRPDGAPDGGVEESCPRVERGTQLSLFPTPYEILLHEIRGLDINAITPLEALGILDRLKNSLPY
jgi:DNA mismatch repair protein MutS